MPAFVFRGKRYPVPEKFTFADARTIKHISGLRMGELNEALEAEDADAILALLVLSMQRVDPTVTVEDLDIDSLTPEEIKIEEDPPDPPAEAAKAARKKTPSSKKRGTSGDQRSPSDTE